MGKRKAMRRLEDAFGETPDVEYFEEDMQGIRTYYSYRRENGLDDFYIDDTSWNDLSMDAVYKRLNASQSTSGEQYFYYMLRSPLLDEEAFGRRRALIDLMEGDPALRLRLQYILTRVGKRRAANTREAFAPTRRSPIFLVLTLLLPLLLLSCIVGVFLSPVFRVPLIALLFINVIYHNVMMHRLEREMGTMNYSVSMVAACLRMQKLGHPVLGGLFPDAFASARKARSIARQGGLVLTFTSDLATYFNMFFLLDLITYERLKNKLSRYHEDIFRMHEAIGAIDAAIAVASYRKGVGETCAPQLDFAPDATPCLRAENLRHPLVRGAVPNTLDTDGSLLITGSNASGKSTFLKGVAINALLAQSLCTALCTAYAATAFHIYSSMAIADDVLAGDSYFIAEIKSIRRIVDAAARGERVLCVIDEVLRGTNTVERIAASAELLASLETEGTLCLAATHDGELCALLPGYRLAHFEERIEDGAVLFDYQLREGPATTRNAIRLLSLLGFDDALVARAEARAQGYLDTGEWRA